MSERINILDDKYVQFRKWLDSVAGKKGLGSRITIGQVLKMLDFLDEIEKKMDDIILKAFGVK